MTQGVFAHVPERRVAQVVSEGHGLGEVFVETQCPRDRTCDLCDFQCMGQTCAVVIAFRSQEHLCLVRQTTERLAVDDAVPVTLVFGTQGIGIERSFTTARGIGERGAGRETPALVGLRALPAQYVQRSPGPLFGQRGLCRR